jgi:hypothetical protein
MIPASELNDALSGSAIVERYGLRGKRRGSEIRLVECPLCRERSAREAIAISAKSGSWCHHGHECGGDALSLIAACEGLDCKRDFRKVAGIAAEIAGLANETEFERERRIEAARARAQREITAELEKRNRNRSTATATWDALPQEDVRGAAYLESRGIDARALVGVARFPSDGVAVAIRDADGCPMSIATRIYEPGNGPKVMALRGHSTRGTMINCASDICAGRDVVVTEGVMDSLTARIAFPSAVVLGANGAGRLAPLVESVVMRVKLARVRLVLVPHADPEGISNTTKAGGIALAAGLELESQLTVISFDAKDLNDAWRAGWRP